VQNFLQHASSGTLDTLTDYCEHPPCLGAATCMTGCDNVTDRVLRTCCSTESNECDQNNCAKYTSEKDCTAASGCTCEGAEENNGDPSKCRTPFKCVAEDPWPPTCSAAGGCADAVVSAALQVCPEKFYNEPRLLGLYTDCTEDRKETTKDLYNAYMRRVPVAPIVPPPPPPPPFTPHYNTDTGKVRGTIQRLPRLLSCLAAIVDPLTNPFKRIRCDSVMCCSGRSPSRS
jgi:hypothetical protein